MLLGRVAEQPSLLQEPPVEQNILRGVTLQNPDPTFKRITDFSVRFGC